MTDAREPSPLGTPLSVELREPVTEAQVARMWRAVEARRAVQKTPARSVLLWAAIGAVLGVSVMVAWEATRAPARQAVEHQHAPAGPLLLQSGQAIVTVALAEHAPAQVVALSDGSRLDVEAGARLEPLASSATDVVFRLAAGRVVFDVVPGGPRRWRVEAGIASVEVVGTRFAVTRAPDHVHVAVERGVVLVRGATVPDGVGRVEAGGELDVRAASAPQGEHDDHADGRKTNAVARDAWRSSAKDGHYAEAYAALGTGGVSRETAEASSVEELLALADVARLSGHPGESVKPLQRILREHADSASAPLAAVTLGRIELAQGEPGEAARAFERALELHVPAGLEEDVYARLVEARAKSGDTDGAASAARDYANRFPNGRRSKDVLRWSPR